MIKISSNNNKNSPNNNKTPNISKLLIFQICTSSTHSIKIIPNFNFLKTMSDTVSSIW